MSGFVTTLNILLPNHHQVVAKSRVFYDFGQTYQVEIYFRNKVFLGGTDFEKELMILPAIHRYELDHRWNRALCDKALILKHLPH